MARSRGSRRQPGAGSAHRRELGTRVGDRYGRWRIRGRATPTDVRLSNVCVHKSNACAGWESGLQRLRRCVRWPTGVRVGYSRVGDRYRRWRSAGRATPTSVRFVQRACITPTPAQGGSRAVARCRDRSHRALMPGRSVTRRLSPFRPNRSDRKSRRVSSSSRPLSDA